MDRKRGVWGKERFGETDAASVLGPFTRAVKMGPPGADVRRTAGETEGSSKTCNQCFAPLLLSPGLSLSGTLGPRPMRPCASTTCHSARQCLFLELKLRH